MQKHISCKNGDSKKTPFGVNSHFYISAHPGDTNGKRLKSKPPGGALH